MYAILRDRLAEPHKVVFSAGWLRSRILGEINPIGPVKLNAGTRGRSRGFHLTLCHGGPYCCPKVDLMAKWRAFVAVIVALSVVLPPVLGNLGVADPAAASEISTSPSHDCCDPDGASAPMSKCQPTPGCAAKCLGLYGPTEVPISLGAAVAEMAPPLIPEIFRPQSAALPFRPPRV